MNANGRRPAWANKADDDKYTGTRGANPSHGLPGKIHAAQSSAPEGAGDLEVLAVAQEAHDRGVSPRDIWQQKGLQEVGEL